MSLRHRVIQEYSTCLYHPYTFYILVKLIQRQLLRNNIRSLVLSRYKLDYKPLLVYRIVPYVIISNLDMLGFRVKL